MKVTRHLHITGRVQGVGYRMYMVHKASELGLAGWVRNRLDGSVEALVQGAPEAVEAIVAWARRGPPNAAVTDVTVSDGGGDYQRFETRPTE